MFNSSPNLKVGPALLSIALWMIGYDGFRLLSFFSLIGDWVILLKVHSIVLSLLGTWSCNETVSLSIQAYGPVLNTMSFLNANDSENARGLHVFPFFKLLNTQLVLYA